MKLHNADMPVTLTAQAMMDICSLSGAAGFVTAGSAFHQFSEENKPDARSVCWNFHNHYASLYFTYDIDTRRLVYYQVDWEDATEKLYSVPSSGQGAPRGAVALLGTAAAMGITIVDDGCYLESEAPESKNDASFSVTH